MKARVGVVDRHPVVVMGLTAILNTHPALHVVAAEASTRALLDTERRLDLVLLGLDAAHRTTPAADVRALRSVGARVIVYSADDRPHLIEEAARAGAASALRTSDAVGPLLQTVLSVLRDEPAASGPMADAVTARAEHLDLTGGGLLTEREAEVLTLYASGETAERVAALLFVSRETVVDHIRRIRSKYAAVGRPAPTKVDLFRRAVEDGIVSSTKASG